MKKVVSALSALVIGAAAFAEGFSISGHVQAGVRDKTENSKYSVEKWKDGDWFGGDSNIEAEVGYENAMGGICFKSSVAIDNTIAWDKAAIDFAMAYANFFDGKLIAEAGKLHERFTGSGGVVDVSFEGNGFRLVGKPVEGLTLAAHVSDLFVAAEEKDSFDADVLAFTAAYDTDAFFVRAGAALAGKYYAGFGYTGVEGLKAIVDFAYNDAGAENIFGYKDAATDAVLPAPEAVTSIGLKVEYSAIENLFLGLKTKVDLCDGESLITIRPAVSYDITSVITASLEADISIPSDDFIDPLTTITPAVTFKASDKAAASVFGTISTDSGRSSHTFGMGVQYNF